MPVADDHADWLKLALVPGIGPESQRKLLAAFGLPGNVLAQSALSLSRIVPAQLARRLQAGPEPECLEAALKWLETQDNHLLTLADADFPPAWFEIGDPPPVAYLKGNRGLLASPALAVVGSRNATAQGNLDAEAFARVLSDAGFCIVSGLALGIDAAAHRGGLAGKSSTIAIIGTGADLIYPARNRDLAHRIAAEGLIVSEFALGTPALAANFPRRNRLISGLSKGCLVVEAALSSGSLITARLAAEQRRDVFALPGSIHSPMSKGCHALIKQGAKLVESADDLLQELLPGLARERPGQATTNSAATHPLLELMGHGLLDVNMICERSGLTPEVVQAQLLELELAGSVAALAGGHYQRIG